ncbi:Probable glutathione S-transferase [Linum grandiflorum]
MEGDDAEVVLLDVEGSPFATRVRIALLEKEIDHQSKYEALSNKSSLLLQMNPVHSQIPVLIHRGKPICESLIILQYIDEVWSHKSPNLLPSLPFQRAHARFWADYIDGKFYTTGRKLWTSRVEVKEELIDCFRVLERELGDKPFLSGESFGFIDMVLISFYGFFYTFQELGNFNLEAECPKIVPWTQRCLQKESVSKSVADQQEVFQRVMEMKEKLLCDRLSMDSPFRLPIPGGTFPVMLLRDRSIPL